MWHVGDVRANVLSRTTYARSDHPDGLAVDAALAASAHTVHEVFQTQRIEHAFLEPESTLAVPHDDGSLEVFSGGQGVWDDRRQIAEVLGIDEARVLVHLVANGGAFGGKEDCANQAQTALAAWLLGRPVKCTFSREESLLVHPKRHPVRVEAWAGCDESGRLTALKARMVGDSGPYASVGMKVIERAAGHASGPYAWPVVDVDAYAVRTNNPVCGAFRGFGANQAQFATEGVLDRLADACGLDRWEIRARNVVTPGVVWGPGQQMDDGCLGARDCLDAVKPLWDEAVACRQGLGLGLGLKNSGWATGFNEVARAVDALRRRLPDRRRRVEVRHCWTEMGRECTPSPSRWQCRSWGSPPPGAGGGRHSLSWAPVRRRVAGPLMARARWPPRRRRATTAAGPVVAYEASTGWTGPRRSAPSTAPPSTRPSATRHNWCGDRPRHRRDRAVVGPRRRQGGQPAAGGARSWGRCKVSATR